MSDAGAERLTRPKTKPPVDEALCREMIRFCDEIEQHHPRYAERVAEYRSGWEDQLYSILETKLRVEA